MKIICDNCRKEFDTDTRLHKEFGEEVRSEEPEQTLCPDCRIIDLD